MAAAVTLVDHSPIRSLARLASQLRSGQLLAGTYALEAFVAISDTELTWDARDRSLDASVLMRLVPADAAHADSMLVQYRREVWFGRHIEHAALVRALHVGSDAGAHFVTMERAAGRPLHQALEARGRFPAREVAHLGVALAEVLEDVHAAGVVHGALTPASVLLDTKGGVILRNLGTAYTLAEIAQGLHPPLGAARYLAPEQLVGLGGDVRVDLYALGLLMFEALTGRPAFDDTSAAEASARRLRQDPPDPARDVSVPGALAVVIRRCLARDPAERFTSAREVARALESPAAPVKPHPATSDAPAQVVIAPFETHGAPELAALVTAAPDELAAMLRQPGSVHARTGTLAHSRVAGRGLLFVVEARVSGTAERVTARVRLRDGFSGASRWAEEFNVAVGPARSVSGAIAWHVAEPVRLTVQSLMAAEGITQETLEKYFVARRLLRSGNLTDPDDAVALLDEVLAVAPTFGPAYAARAMACVRAWSTLRATAPARDWYDEAQTSISRSLTHAPDAAETHFARAHLATLLGRYRDAMTAIRQALARAPTMPEAHQVLGSLQLEAGRSQLGLERLDLALALDEHLPRALLEKARWHALYGDHDVAEATLARLSSLPETGHLVGHLWARAGAWRRDNALVRRGLSVLERASPLVAPLMVSYSRAALDRAEVDAAMATFQDAMAASATPKQRAMLRQLCAELLCFWGDWERAATYVREAADATLVDLEWIDWCPLLHGLRRREEFAGLREKVAARSAEIWQL